MNGLLTISDLETLKRKLSAPSPALAALYKRFCGRLASDPAFRANNIFLPALLGEPVAVAEARQRVLDKVASFGRLDKSVDSVENHTWCVAPDIARYAAYFT